MRTTGRLVATVLTLAVAVVMIVVVVSATPGHEPALAPPIHLTGEGATSSPEPRSDEPLPIAPAGERHNDDGRTEAGQDEADDDRDGGEQDDDDGGTKDGTVSAGSPTDD
jgi:hypothetical protein